MTRVGSRDWPDTGMISLGCVVALLVAVAAVYGRPTPARSVDVVLVGAGDIASCSGSGDEATEIGVAPELFGGGLMLGRSRTG